MTAVISRRDPVSRALISLGAVLGMAAGVIQATVGSRIPAWTGAKADPVALGILTVVVSALALVAALRMSPSLRREQRLGALAFVAVMALLCLTTVGRLWLAPGPLLLLGAAVAVRPRTDLTMPTRRGWVQALLVVLGGVELVMAASAPLVTMAIGVLGGGALIACGWLLARSTIAAAVLLVIGTLPFAVVAWWAIVPVLVLVLASALAVPQLSSGRGLGAERTPQRSGAR